jgi:hypothetical protein
MSIATDTLIRARGRVRFAEKELCGEGRLGSIARPATLFGSPSLTAMGSKRTLHRTRRKGSADKRFRHCVYVHLLATHHEDHC